MKKHNKNYNKNYNKNITKTTFFKKSFFRLVVSNNKNSKNNKTEKVFVMVFVMAQTLIKSLFFTVI